MLPLAGGDAVRAQIGKAGSRDRAVGVASDELKPYASREGRCFATLPPLHPLQMQRNRAAAAARDLPRETRKYPPKHTACPDCGGALKHLGEDVSEMLEYRAGALPGNPAGATEPGLVRAASASCKRKRRAVQSSAALLPGLLAHVLVSKYCDHPPLYRQPGNLRARRRGAERSTLADWVGGTSALLAPLVEVLRRHVMSATKLHVDDTPVPVLAPGNGKTKTGRLWTYVRDDRPAGNTTPAAVWFAHTPDRKGEHPRRT